MRNQIVLSINPFNPEQEVIDYGIAVAKKLNLPIHIYSVHYSAVPVMPEAGVYPPRQIPDQIPENVREEAEGRLNELCKEVRKTWPQTTYEFELGYMAETIVDKSRWLMKEANKRNPYLIILQKNHEYNWWNEVFGTSETSIAAKASCPVLILPTDIHYHGIQRLMYLMDENTVNAEHITRLSRFANAFNATIAAVYLAEEGKKLPAEELDRKMDSVRKLIPSTPFFHYQFEPKNTAEEIMQIAEWSKTDVVAFPFQESNFLNRLFDNENTERLILKASVPVIVF